MQKFYKVYSWAFIILTVAFFIYYPGLSGGYILDDESNLSILKTINGDFSLANLKEYIGSSKSGILKRPISIFSFLIDSNTWPTNPWSFKRTNLFIHLFNGLLLFTLYYKIFHQAKQFRTDACFIALLGMTLWLLHPFLVSSVLYIVQRMAMLVMTFVLIGLLIYVVGREQYERSSGQKGVFYMLLGVYVLPIFAVLSKENGILLVYYIILMEIFVFRFFIKYKPITQKIKFWLYLPAVLTTIALLVKLPSFIQTYYFREFTLLERVLTQFRAITTYLFHIFLPKYFTEGAYTDGFTISHGLFEPFTTFLSFIFVIAVLVSAWFLRKTRPLISFSIYFFFVAHLMESTIIPLELYYEHRNYVPMLFVFLPLILLLNNLRKSHRLAHLVILTLVIFFTFITFLRVSLWGNDFKLHLQTMNKYPGSVRAITMVAIKYEEKNELINSYKTLKKGMEVNGAFEIKINYLNVLCTAKLISEQHLNVLYENSKKNHMTSKSLPPFNALFSNLLEDKCGIGREIETSNILLKTIEENSFESNLDKKPIIYFYKAQLDFKENKYREAVNWFVQSFHWKPNFESLFLFSQDLIVNNQRELAIEVLDVGRKTYKNRFKYSVDWFNYNQTFLMFRKSIETMEVR